MTILSRFINVSKFGSLFFKIFLLSGFEGTTSKFLSSIDVLFSGFLGSATSFTVEFEKIRKPDNKNVNKTVSENLNLKKFLKNFLTLSVNSLNLLVTAAHLFHFLSFYFLLTLGLVDV